jgi:hypothetical protein
MHSVSRGSTVTSYGLDNRSILLRLPAGSEDTFYLPSVYTVIGPKQPPIQQVSRALYAELKRPSNEAERSPASSTDFPNKWISTSVSPYALISCRETVLLSLVCRAFSEQIWTGTLVSRHSFLAFDETEQGCMCQEIQGCCAQVLRDVKC